jgi:preprotein translocase subunit SecE
MSENTAIAPKKASIVDFFKGVVLELKRVDWPSREKTIQLTLIVIGVSLVTGLFIGALDIGFTKLVEIVLAMKNK